MTDHSFLKWLLLIPKERRVRIYEDAVQAGIDWTGYSENLFKIHEMGR